MTAERGRCRSCGQPIQWARTNTGKLMPVDLGTDPDGNLVLFRDQGLLCVAVVGADAAVAGPRHLSHFVTCPDAAGHRKPRPTQGRLL